MAARAGLAEVSASRTAAVSRGRGSVVAATQARSRVVGSTNTSLRALSTLKIEPNARAVVARGTPSAGRAASTSARAISRKSDDLGPPSG